MIYDTLAPLCRSLGVLQIPGRQRSTETIIYTVQRNIVSYCLIPYKACTVHACSVLSYTVQCNIVSYCLIPYKACTVHACSVLSYTVQCNIVFCLYCTPSNGCVHACVTGCYFFFGQLSYVCIECVCALIIGYL